MFAKEFFELQVEFARTASRLAGIAFAQALLDYTNLYVRFGLGREFDAEHPVWQDYLEGVREQRDVGEWTHLFYGARGARVAPPNVVASFGCFSHAWLSDTQIRLHFHDAETDGMSPLSIGRRDRRLAELAALFAHVKATRGSDARVVGASWLYNTEAYRRLFPRAYLSTAHPIDRRFRHMPLWGQFVNRYGAVRADTAREFRERLGRQTHPNDLSQCFPFQVLSLEAAAGSFYEFYGV